FRVLVLWRSRNVFLDLVCGILRFRVRAGVFRSRLGLRYRGGSRVIERHLDRAGRRLGDRIGPVLLHMPEVARLAVLADKNDDTRSDRLAIVGHFPRDRRGSVTTRTASRAKAYHHEKR